MLGCGKRNFLTVDEPSTFHDERPMACRWMNPQDIGPSLLTAVNVMKEMSDGVGGWEENKWSVKPRRRPRLYGNE